MFNYVNVSNICICIEDGYYLEELTNYFVEYFENNSYSFQIKSPYKDSLVLNKYYGLKNIGTISILIEINKGIYENDFDKFKNHTLDTKVSVYYIDNATGKKDISVFV